MKKQILSAGNVGGSTWEKSREGRIKSEMRGGKKEISEDGKSKWRGCTEVKEGTKLSVRAR